MLRVAGAALAIVGALVVLGHLRYGMYGIFPMGGLIGFVMLYVGLQLARGRSLSDSPFGLPSTTSQNYPAGFEATYAHKDIAIDTKAGTVCLRDRGTAVINKATILGVQAQSDSSNHQTNIGPRTVHLHCRLIVRTRDIAKPVWTIPFNAHFSRSVSGGKANYEETQAWEGRLLAFLAAP